MSLDSLHGDECLNLGKVAPLRIVKIRLNCTLQVRKLAIRGGAFRLRIDQQGVPPFRPYSLEVAT
jgi:hypothetical protein